jgi:hypothetical protein
MKSRMPRPFPLKMQEDPFLQPAIYRRAGIEDLEEKGAERE